MGGWLVGVNTLFNFLNPFFMKHQTYDCYISPEVEILRIAVERGYSSSYGGADPDPTRPGEDILFPDEETDW